ncbi:hypothetical protein [Herbaspirillum sp. C9C3]|uniref:hypothetical protein n=1 Tax=Herbaspirillum sp. C9C3 TaxID=2735271 RepID=UPI001585A91C|nr:hypothetical protein [Herbaspirillum sp. C9C3]NUT60765.1 hypothetical protein [Herbaspirillum sp. C9C3]
MKKKFIVPKVSEPTKRKSKFAGLPPPPKSVALLGTLVFDHPDFTGPGCVLDLTSYETNHPLARDFIAGMTKYVAISKIEGEKSLFAYYASIRIFMDFCVAEKVPSTFRMRDIENEFLRKYKAFLTDHYLDNKSSVKRRRYGDLVRLLDAGELAGLRQPTEKPPRNFKFIDDGDRTEPYMDSESIDMEAEFSKAVDQVKERIERGKVLLEQGTNPRSLKAPRNRKTGQIERQTDNRPWNRLENLIWYVVNVLEGQYKPTKAVKKDHSSYVKAISGGWHGPFRLNDVFGHLYPLNHDMSPFLQLLIQKTDLNEAPIATLKRDCLRHVGGNSYNLDYVKKRSKGVRGSKRLVDDGPYSAVSIIRLLLQLTEPLVAFAEEEHKNDLFLCLTIGGGTTPVKPFDTCYGKYLLNGADGWAEQRGLKDQHGDTLKVRSRRLRTTGLNKDYRRHGNLKKTMTYAAHRSTETTERHYINNKSNRLTHDRTVVRGIKGAMSVSKPAIVIDIDVATASAKLKMSKESTKKILEGEQDVLFVSCRDFNNRPDGPAETPCDQPWGCLGCGNAIITPHVLPRVILFRNFMLKEKKLLTADEFSDKFGSSLEIIVNDILPSFKASFIEHAEQQATNEVFYVPIHFRS